MRAGDQLRHMTPHRSKSEMSPLPLFRSSTMTSAIPSSRLGGGSPAGSRPTSPRIKSQHGGKLGLQDMHQPSDTKFSSPLEAFRSASFEIRRTLSNASRTTNEEVSGMGGPTSGPVYLSLTGAMSGDDRAFDIIYDREDFRNMAQEILVKLIPHDRKDASSSKRDRPPQWITLCAQQINQAFKIRMKTIISTSRSHNDGERRVLGDWLTERDETIADLRKESQRLAEECERLSGQLSQQHTLFGMQQSEKLEALQGAGEMKDLLEESRRETQRSLGREKVTLDALSEAMEAKEKAVAQLAEMRAQQEEVSGDKAGLERQFKELKEALRNQAGMFEKLERGAEEGVKQQHAVLVSRIAESEEEIDRLRGRLSAKDQEMEGLKSTVMEGDARHALKAIQAKGEFQAREAELLAKVRMGENLQVELDQARQYALTLVQAYQDQGHSIMVHQQGSMPVRKTWEAIFRYVASTNWGRAASLDPDAIGRMSQSTQGTQGTHTGSKLKGAGQRPGSASSARRRLSASPRPGGAASPPHTGRSIVATPAFGRGLFLEETLQQTRSRDGGETDTVGVVLGKLRAKWETVYSTFQKFSGRKSEEGGYDWYFDRREWLTTLRLLNTGLPDEMIMAAFDALENGDGRLTFDELQGAMRDTNPSSPQSPPSNGAGGHGKSIASRVAAAPPRSLPGTPGVSMRSPPLSAVSRAITASPGGGGLSRRLANAAKSPGWDA